MDQPSVHDVHGLVQSCDRHLDEVPNEDLSMLLTNAHILRLRIEQVRHLLKVDLKEGNVDFPVGDEIFILQFF